MLQLIKKWPFTTWWLAGLLTFLAGLVAFNGFGASYDDGRMGTALFVLGLVTGVPIEMTKEFVHSLRGADAYGPADTYLGVITAGPVSVLLDFAVRSTLRKLVQFLGHS